MMAPCSDRGMDYLTQVMFWSLLLVFSLCSVSAYRIGVGIADMTGPPAEVAFMGYANPEQKGSGLHTRQFSRAFIVEQNGSRLVFVSADCGMMGTFLKREVVRRLRKTYGDLYTDENVMLSGTHTHSTPGGFLMDIIFDLNTWGFVPETFEAYAAGIVRSVSRAHKNQVEGTAEYSIGKVPDASINRSPTAYLRNPQNERDRYESNVDKTFSQLKFFRMSDGLPLGVITWFAVHPTSMNNTNKLLSSDNVGLASVLFERRVNSRYTKLIGKGPFVAAFASTNLGDVSPNIRGARCVPSGQPCDPATSACADKKDQCIASGPGRDMFESTAIIADRIFQSAWSTWRSKGRRVSGPIKVVHQYVDMASQKAQYRDPKTGEITQVKGCLAAMGYSFAAGTTDGPGAFSFKQGTTSTNPLWNALTDLLAKPTAEQKACQAPKPILLATGEMNFPFEWQPAVVSTQLARMGDLALACVPGEFTTMSGRRLRRAVAGRLGTSPENVVVVGLCNTYSDYITTPEEYQVQRYEGASTIYGPHTLTIYLKQYSMLADFIKKEGGKPSPGPTPPTSFSDVVSLLPPVIWDTAGWGKKFGEVLEQPRPAVRQGETVSAVFVAGHPRNGCQQEGSYLEVQQSVGDKWEVIATDANWETRFIWNRDNPILGTSSATVRWDVPKNTEPGKYRLKHYGHFKHVFTGVNAYEGVSAPFQVGLGDTPECIGTSMKGPLARRESSEDCYRYGFVAINFEVPMSSSKRCY